jgi:hypothetical protein
MDGMQTLSFSACVTPEGGNEVDADFHTYVGIFKARVEWNTPAGNKDKIYAVSDFGHKREVDDDMFANVRDAAQVSVAFLLLSIIGALGACYPLMYLASDEAHPTKQTLAAVCPRPPEAEPLSFFFSFSHFPTHPT